MNNKRWLFLIISTIIIVLLFFMKYADILYSMRDLSKEPFLLSVFLKDEIIKNFYNLTKFNIPLKYIEVFFCFKIDAFLYCIISYVLGILFSCIFLFFKKTFFIQGSVLFKKEKNNILKNGIIFYSSFIAVIFLFFISVVGYGISFIFSVLFYFFAFLGKISLSIEISQLFIKNKNVYLNIIAGYSFMEFLKYMPYIGMVITIVIIPIISLGIFSRTFYNIYIDKKYYEVDFYGKGENSFDKNKIYDIILSNKNKEEK